MMRQWPAAWSRMSDFERARAIQLAASGNGLDADLYIASLVLGGLL